MGRNVNAEADTLVASFPMPYAHTYYFWLYYKALEKYGFSLVDTKGEFLTFKWLFNNAGSVKILHFHWPAYIYSNSSFLVFLKRLVLFVMRLVTARLLGYRIYWTVHNIYPHEKNNAALEYAGRFALVWLSNALFVHFSGAKYEVGRKFLRKHGVVEIPHGNFHDVFNDKASRNEAREKLGVSESSFVYLIAGLIRPYKGIDDAITVFNRIRRSNDILLIAGLPHNEEEKMWLEKETEGDDHIILFPRHIEEDEMGFFFKAADVVLLPYKNIFTSGNLFLAFTFGRPVIAPDMGIISELLDGSAGIKYTPGTNNHGLEGAMEKITKMDLDRLSRASYEKGMQFSWDKSASISADVFRGRIARL
jgi:beta-1,4-mannosyltransferase